MGSKAPRDSAERDIPSPAPPCTQAGAPLRKTFMMVISLVAREAGIMSRQSMAAFILGVGLLAMALSAVSLAQASPAVGPNPSKNLTIPLYGSMANPAGWGWTPNNISNSLTITVQQGDVITFQLYSNDSQPHELVIDLDNSHTLTTGDKNSTTFSSATTATSFAYTASTPGTFAIFCNIHGYSMQHGTLVVQGAAPPASDNMMLIIGGVVAVVVIVAGAGAIMMRRRKPKQPQPPQP
jgi:Alphavirus glycoprotein J